MFFVNFRKKILRKKKTKQSIDPCFSSEVREFKILERSFPKLEIKAAATVWGIV